MKKSIFYTVIMALVVLTTACSSDDDLMAETTGKQSDSMKSEKTVLVYMAGRNDLTQDVNTDLDEIKDGSRRIGDDCNLLVFVRRFEKKETPWLARIKNGEVTDSVSLNDMGVKSSDGQMRGSDPIVMEGVMRYAFRHYQSLTGYYGLVLWGHGSGWLMKDEVKKSTRAYGVDWGNDDNSDNGLWLNIPSLAEILKNMPHMKFIMADCCNFMCLENLYELRNTCDYIIGSPAEIPGQGAPYDQIVPDMFADGTFYTSIIDKYHNSVYGLLPLTVVKTSEMENVAQATRQALQAVKSNSGNTYADMTGIIHYYHTDKKIFDANDKIIFRPEYNIFYDAGDFFLANAPKDVYQQWKQALDKAIVVKRNATFWNTDKNWRYKYSDFTVTDEKMHGVSMFVPQDPVGGNYAKYNEDIKKMSWCKVVQLF